MPSNLTSYFVERWQHLPPPLTRTLVVEHKLKVPMRDGTFLLADRWAPKGGGAGLPVALLRSPYGRSGGVFARPLAERGYQVLMESTRGTFGSGGTLDPFRQERDDGLDTLDWIIKQPWFGESIVLVGGSYLGYVQWAVADAAPPQVKAEQRFYLQPAGSLTTKHPVSSASDAYRYDPADPTPAIGGVRMTLSTRAGRVNNAKLEARPDVLTYTTPPLEQDVEVVGEISAEIWFCSSLPFADVFVRLCDVDVKGRSFNVCDGLTSVSGADQRSCVRVRLWPTAYHFKKGHRLRVQVSSGAFPRYNRNSGTGEARRKAVMLRAAEQQVFHDPDHPSALILPLKRLPEYHRATE